MRRAWSLERAWGSSAFHLARVGDAVIDGAFRPDLYARLGELVVNLPPLRDRREEIPTLVEHFVIKHARASAPSVSLA